MANKNLSNARNEKKDEFYTQYYDIEREVQAYLDYNPDVFKGKTVFCNCDDPYESNFFKYFASNFNLLGLKKLIVTCYDGSPVQGNELLLDFGDITQDEPKKIAHKLVITEVLDLNGDGAIDLTDVQELIKNDKNVLSLLKGNGDFRSAECVELLKESDIVVTNPPFSLFREYIAQLVEYNKKFLIIGNVNAITYKEIFPLIRDNKIWLGPSITSGDRKFYVPDDYELKAAGCGIENGRKFIRVKGVRWFTNLEHNKRHQPLTLMTIEDNLRYSKHKEIKGKTVYDCYDNYDAIEVPYTDAIPNDYEGVMGVPITFLDKYCPEQFEIIDINPHFYAIVEQGKEKPRQLTLKNANKKAPYARILIRKKQ